MGRHSTTNQWSVPISVNAIVALLHQTLPEDFEYEKGDVVTVEFPLADGVEFKSQDYVGGWWIQYDHLDNQEENLPFRMGQHGKDIAAKLIITRRAEDKF